MELAEVEREFFVNLCMFNQAKNTEDQLEYSKKIVSSKKIRKRLLISSEMVNYYQSWLTVAVREVISYYPQGATYEQIQKTFLEHVESSDLKKSLATLETLNLVEKKNSLYISTKEVLVTPKETGSIVIPFHISMIQKGIQSIRDINSDQREISCMTFKIAAEDLKLYKSAIYKFYEEMLSISGQSKDAATVYQINVQFFPLSHDLKNGAGD